ncbi:MAG TPA: hypothetical protein VNT76_07520 [Candidatus Binatus sp.]|nr:hypothetical protein [Candidatus Binatus sp.]
MRYASILRCLGQAFETVELKAVEIKIHGDEYVVQAWHKGTSMAMDIEKHFTLGEIRNLDAASRECRKPFGGPPDLLSLSQILRLAGNYVDRLRGRLVRVSWQDQSDKIQSITVQWQPNQPEQGVKPSTSSTVEELCIHIYKQRKKINLSSDREGHRPYVSVGRAR